jgi:DNA-damage-inducible protein J
MTTPTQIRIDSDIKTQANKIFALLGLDMSSAVNLFLHQCVIRGGLPFNVEIPNYNAETLAAIEEAKQISSDANVTGFKTVEELKKALEDND